jgi:hypothetical protein
MTANAKGGSTMTSKQDYGDVVVRVKHYPRVKRDRGVKTYTCAHPRVEHKQVSMLGYKVCPNYTQVLQKVTDDA